ncbi:MAG: hypothetical protein U1F36_15610 [Planctomycetota bacterium]
MRTTAFARAATVLLCVFAAAPLVAQQNFTLPVVVGNMVDTTFPFGGPRMRYQQWYSPIDWFQRVQQPVRVTNLQFRAGPTGGAVAGRQVEIEVTMGNSSPVNPTSSFEANFVSGRVTVFPRAFVTLPQSIPGNWPVSLAFTNEFVWDGVSGVILEIKLWNNGNNNNSWTYNLAYDAAGGGSVYRMWDATNGPTSNFAQFFAAGQGLITRFNYANALSMPYGTGCAGEGGFIPVASTTGGHPVPGNSNWTHVLTNAPSQRQALFFMGFSATQWGSFSLPLDLSSIGAPGCNLLAEYVAGVTIPTVGGGPGAGIAQLRLPTPPTTNWVGVMLFSQWLVLDPNASNGLLAASNGVWTQTAMN